MKIKKLSVVVSTALAVAYLPVQADDGGLGGGPEVKLRGFGTFGVVRNTNSNVDFLDNLSQPRGAGYSHKWDFGVDSKLAVQADAKFNDKLSASWQVMSQRQTNDTYQPQNEIAFLKYQATGDLNVRLGRIPAPLFMVSEYRKVGYVNPWIRQPNEVYFQVPFNSVDGGDVSYQFGAGDFTGNFQVAAGTMRPATVKSEGDVSTLTGDNALTINFIGEYGPVTFRIGHSRTKISYSGESLNRLYGGLHNIAAHGNNVSASTIGAGKFKDNKGLPGMVYNTVYSSAVTNNVINSATFQSNLAAYQTQYPNMSTESLTSLLLNSGSPTITAALTQAAGAADLAAGTYYTATTTAAGSATLSDAALKGHAGELYDQYAADKKMGEFTGVGIIIDPGTWLIQGEYTKRKTESFVADSTGWYLTAGYRFGKIMPFVSFSDLKVDSPTDAPTLINAAGQQALAGAGLACTQGAPAAQMAAALAAAGKTPAEITQSINSTCFAGYGVTNSLSQGVDKTVKSTSYGQKNISLGLRWDAFKSAAIKFQYDRIDMEKYSRGTPNNYAHTIVNPGTPTDPSIGSTTLLGTADNYASPTDPKNLAGGGQTAVTQFDKTKPLNVFSLAVDFVF
jgi:hypothetical protein